MLPRSHEIKIAITNLKTEGGQVQMRVEPAKTTICIGLKRGKSVFLWLNFEILRYCGFVRNCNVNKNYIIHLFLQCSQLS